MCETSLVRREGLVQIKCHMTLRRFTAQALLAAAALGCGADSHSAALDGPSVSGGQTGEETTGCQPVQTRRLAWSERSPLGFSADELLNSLGAQRDARLTWEDGTSTTLSLALARGASGSVEYQEREYGSDSSGAEPAAAIGTECLDVVSIPITLSFSTGDGAFAEEWALPLLAESATRATGFSKIELSALEGSFTVTQIDPAQFDEVLAHVTLTLASNAWSGALAGEAVKATGSSPSDSVSARSFDIGSF
jgi:hypothetical protein